MMRLYKRGNVSTLMMMKRLVAVLALALFLVQPALAFDTRKSTGNRITVLQAPVYRGEYEDRVSARVRERLVDELRSRGFDAVDGRVTYDVLQREAPLDSDLYVELAPSRIDERPVAGVALPIPSGAVDIAVIVSRVAAELRVYDGRSLALISKRHLHAQNATVMPVAARAGGSRISAAIVLPFVEYARYRAAVNAVVGDAADEIAGLRR